MDMHTPTRKLLLSDECYNDEEQQNPIQQSLGEPCPSHGRWFVGHPSIHDSLVRAALLLASGAYIASKVVRVAEIAKLVLWRESRQTGLRFCPHIQHCTVRRYVMYASSPMNTGIDVIIFSKLSQQRLSSGCAGSEFFARDLRVVLRVLACFHCPVKETPIAWPYTPHLYPY